MPTNQEIGIAITGNLGGLTTAMTQAQETVQRTTQAMQSQTQVMAGAFEGMQKRFEHSGVMIAFAISNLANDSEKGVSRALHSIAMLGFAFGPVVGAVTTAVSLIVEQIDRMVHESETKVKEFTKTLAEATNAGNMVDLQKQLQDVLVGKPADGGKLAEPSKLVIGAWKGGLMDLRAEMARVQAQDPFGPEHAKRFAPFAKALAELEEKFRLINEHIQAAQTQLLHEAGSTGVGKATITVDSPEKTAREKKKALEEKLNAMFAENNLERHLSETLSNILDKAAEHDLNTMKEKEKFQEELAKRSEQVQLELTRARAEMDQVGAHGLEEARHGQQLYLEQLRHGYEQTFATMNNMVTTHVENVIRGTEKMSHFWKAMLGDVLRMMIANSAKSLEIWLATELLKRKSSAATGKATILNDAWKAAAGTYSSVSEIPIVGPFLAPAAAAAAFAAVAAFGSGLTSAAGGFDVPAGVNPVTQLHAREMVLPAELADQVRSGQGGAMTVHISAMDAGSFRDFARRHADTFHDAVVHAANSGRGE